MQVREGRVLEVLHKPDLIHLNAVVVWAHLQESSLTGAESLTL